MAKKTTSAWNVWLTWPTAPISPIACNALAHVVALAVPAPTSTPIMGHTSNRPPRECNRTRRPQNSAWPVFRCAIDRAAFLPANRVRGRSTVADRRKWRRCRRNCHQWLRPFQAVWMPVCRAMDDGTHCCFRSNWNWDCRGWAFWWARQTPFAATYWSNAGSAAIVV